MVFLVFLLVVAAVVAVRSSSTGFANLAVMFMAFDGKAKVS